MKANIHFLSYIAEIFLEWKMLQTKVVEKIKTLFFMFSDIILISYRLRDNLKNDV